MDRNRRINGAANPNSSASEDAAHQRAQDRLSTNPDLPSGAQERTFMPELPHPEETNREIINRQTARDWKAPYEAHIPVGPNMGLSAGAGETPQDHLPPMGKGKK